MQEPLHAGLAPVAPTIPPAPYQGGKRYLAKRIIGRLAEMPHHTYAEPFTGMGGVFLRRPFRARAEVINDISRDVVTLFRVLQRHYQALMDMLRWQLTSRAQFDLLRSADPDTLTDLERAARFLYLQRIAFGGKVVGRNFGTTPTLPGRFDVTKLEPLLADVHERLAGVTVECLPFATFIERYDRAETLFYLDPPYYDCERQYGAGVYERADFARLAQQLRTIRGAFLLSLNDCPAVRELFTGFSIEAVPTVYHVSGQAQRVSEVLISR